MADNFNHANELVSWGLLNTKMHMTAKPEDTYFHTERFMNNFSVLYANESLSELSLEQRVNAKKNIKGSGHLSVSKCCESKRNGRGSGL